MELAGASALHHLPGELRSPSCHFPTPGRPQFAILRTGLLGHSECQWKEMLVVVTGMSGQMGK